MGYRLKLVAGKLGQRLVGGNQELRLEQLESR